MHLKTSHMVLTACNATGTNTTGHSLSRGAISMAKHPEWLEKIWEEQQSIIATEGEDITPEVRM
jgi:cytochrome P450